MKTHLLLLLLTFVIESAFGQKNNDTLQKIDLVVRAIDKDSNYWVSVFNNEAFLDTAFINQPNKGYGRLTGFFKNGKICKIRELTGIAMLLETAITDYYFSNGKLVYVHEQEWQGDVGFVENAGTPVVADPSFAVSYYFYDEKLVFSKEKGIRKTMLLPNADFFDSQSKEGQLMFTAKKYYTMFSIKYK